MGPGLYNRVARQETSVKGTLKPEKKRLSCLACVMSGGNHAPPIICQIPSLWWSMVVAASCFGGVFQWQGLGHWSVLREAGRSNRDILNKNLVHSAQDVRLGRRFTFQQDNVPQHTAKTAREWLRDNSVTVLECPSQNTDFNPIENLWRDLITNCPHQI